MNNFPKELLIAVSKLPYLSGSREMARKEELNAFTLLISLLQISPKQLMFLMRFIMGAKLFQSHLQF